MRRTEMFEAPKETYEPMSEGGAGPISKSCLSPDCNDVGIVSLLCDVVSSDDNDDGNDGSDVDKGNGGDGGDNNDVEGAGFTISDVRFIVSDGKDDRNEDKNVDVDDIDGVDDESSVSASSSRSSAMSKEESSGMLGGIWC